MSIRSFLKRNQKLFVLLVGGCFLLLCFFLYFSLTHKEEVVEWVGSKTGHPVQVESVQFKDKFSLEVKDFKVGNFARLDHLEIKWSLKGLENRELDELRVYGLHLSLNQLQKAMATQKDSKFKKPNFPFTLKKLILAQCTLVLDNLGPGIPPVPLRIADVTPLVLEDLKLGQDKNDPSAMEIQVAEAEDIIMMSPYDPLTPVLSFDTIRIAFSWAGIQEQQIDRLTITRPTIYVGEDLFWFTEEIQKQGITQKQKISNPWTISNFEMTGGQLVVTTFGKPGLTLPFVFETQQYGLILGDFSEIPLKTEFDIRPNNLYYADYDLRITDMSGKLYFSLPLKENSNNVVPWFKISSLEWKGIKASQLSMDLTFDPNGIYGDFNGMAYDGSLSGGFAIKMDKEFTWTGWGSTTNVEVNPVTQLLSPNDFLMEGPVSSRFIVQGKNKNILGLGGEVQLTTPGTVKIASAEQLISKMPADWPLFKKDAMTILLDSFQTYNYTEGKCEFTYAPPESFLRLNLNGLQGERDFDIRWHDKRRNPGYGFKK